SYKWAILAGALMGLSLVTKYSAIALFVYATAFLLGLVVYDFVKKKGDLKKNLISLSLFYLAVLLVIIVVYLLFVISLSNSDQQTLMSRNWSGHLSRFSSDILNFLVSFSVITKALAVWLNGLFI